MRRRLRGKARPGGAWQGWVGQCLVWPGEAGVLTRNRYSVAVTGAGRGNDRSVVTILLDRLDRFCGARAIRRRPRRIRHLNQTAVRNSNGHRLAKHGTDIAGWAIGYQ